MKNLFKMFVAIVAISALTLTSCSKYEEGPGFTVRTAKARVSGDWKVTNFTVNGTAYSSGITVTMTIEKSGSYTATYTTSLGATTETGTWAFNDDKTTISFTASTAGSVADTYTIVELKSKEMKLKQIDGSYTYITTYTAQ
jgi:hypothetical protein